MLKEGESTMKYYINGFREGRSYFMSFGFTEDEITRMENGEVITHGGNKFWIIKEGE